MSKLLSLKDMAEALGMPVSSLYQKRHKGDFPVSYKIGGAVRVKEEDFLTWLESKKEMA
ncbi:helix-turn-helix transcriptional regulator [Rhodococcus sp. 2G]|uniref:helix-turn-helix transcriptional regulator n=1 Tax=Rhodococcus sp. 2G TaxID=1570939 RepID=UPI00090340F8|nr:helix-turn-helix domain-containing protein [Rhodococcus sp. 2G]